MALRDTPWLALVMLCAGIGCSAEHVVGSLGWGKAVRYEAAAAQALALADFDGDGFADAVTQGTDQTTLCFYRGQTGRGLLAPVCQTMADAASTLCAGPILGTGAQLLRAGKKLFQLSVTADGRFVQQAAYPLAAGGGAKRLFALDVSSDAVPDALVLSDAPPRLQVWRTDPGGLTPAGDYALPVVGQAVLYQDLSGDGYPELAVLLADTLVLLGPRGVAQGCTSPRFLAPVALWPVWHDFAALLVLDAATRRLSILRARPDRNGVWDCAGSLPLPPPAPGLTADGAQPVAAAVDLDNDGQQELVVSEPTGVLSAFRYRLGEVTAWTHTATGETWSALAAADLDGDGHMDLVGLSTAGDALVVVANGFGPSRRL